jgi:ABC-type branched-subunit amino acid transport system ATPase component
LPAPLQVSEVCVRYGGVLAVDRLSLAVPGAAITGLVGPNGAGKTTTFNVISGLVRPTSGSVLVRGRDVAHLGPARRAQLGVGRTFQRSQLFDSLTVAENIAVGQEAHLAGANPLRQLAGTRQDRRRVDDQVRAAVELVGVEHLLGMQAGLLTLGQRRLVELARALAGGFDILLLDEPSSGLDSTQTEFFGGVLQRVAERGAAILLVEHDMSLVTAVCNRVYVMDFGRLIFEGSAADMASNDLVRSAYLGETEALETVAPPVVEAPR